MSISEPRRIPERLGKVAFAACVGFLLAGCGESLGACEGFSDFLNASYCNDGWTADECAEWDAMEVNAADWFFHEGQTCEDRGFQLVDGQNIR